MPRILVDSCDVLVVDRIGKNFNGDGMDPNITGTFPSHLVSGGIKSKRVCALDLSDETHGNALMIGISSVTTQRAVDKMDLQAMYCNIITSTVLEGAKIPLIAESDKEAIQVCLLTANGIDRRNPRIVRIANSTNIERIMLSEAYLEEIKGIKGLSVEITLCKIHSD